MTAEKFTKIAKNCGYGCGECIKEYIQQTGRADFTEADFVELFRRNESRSEAQNRSNMKYKWRRYEGTLCTKHFRNTGKDG